MVRYSVRALTVLVVLVTAVALAPAGPANAQSRAASVGDQVVQKTNVQRQRHGQRTLRTQSCLTTMAQHQARRMARRGTLFHQDLHRVARRCNVRMAGENVAYGYRNGQATVRAWMRSPSHRSNILKRRFRLVGVGVVRKNGQWWVAQVFGRK